MTKKRILIVDDDAATCETLADLFESEGYAAFVAFTGREAIEKAGELPFEVVLLDVRMPGMDGVEVLREMRRIFPATKVLMITAHAESGLLEEALELGACGFRTKPLDLRKLLLAVEEACRDCSG